MTRRIRDRLLRVGIRTKLLGGFGMCVMLTVLLGMFAIYEISNIARTTQALYEEQTLGMKWMLHTNEELNQSALP